jgi:hypothetical protein
MLVVLVTIRGVTCVDLRGIAEPGASVLLS